MFQHGEIAGAQGKRTDLTTAYDIIMSGGTKGDVYLDNPNMARYHGALDDLIKNREDTLYGNMIIEDRQVMFIQGGFGVGKTESVYRQHGVKNVHSTDNYSFPGDGYNHQEVTLFDEFYSSFEMSLMLKLLQGKPFKMNVKGSYIYNTSKYIYMTSNSNIEEQYKNIKEDNPERWGAFIRRIDILRDYTDYLKFTDYRVVNVESEERDKQGRKIQKYDFVNDEKTLSYFGHNWTYTEAKQGKYDVIKYINLNAEKGTVEKEENPEPTEEKDINLEDIANAW